LKIVIVTGGFDPVHSGHIECFKAARSLGDKLIVGINSDNWLTRKKGLYPSDDIIFANGGDRTANNIPEMVFDDVEFVFGVGGDDKKNSSSWILKNWKQE